MLPHTLDLAAASCHYRRRRRLGIRTVAATSRMGADLEETRDGERDNVTTHVHLMC